MSEDCDATKWNLGQNANNLPDGKGSDVVAPQQKYGYQGRDGNEKQPDGDQSVAKFDPNMDLALRLMGHRRI